MDRLLILVTALTLFVICDARPSVVTPTPIEPDEAANRVRIRRQNFDYGDYMANFWKKSASCPGCRVLSAGNGYKNTNKMYFGNGEQLRNFDTIIVGNGERNTNTMYFGPRPRLGDRDPFDMPFFKN